MSFPAPFSRLFAFAMLCGMLWSPGTVRATERPTDPAIQLLGVELVKARLLEQLFVLRFRMDNPGGGKLLVRRIDYTLYLGDIKLATDKWKHWFTIPAHSYKEFEVPVRTNLWKNMRALSKLLENRNKPIPYRLRGEARTGLLFGGTVQLSANGQIMPADFMTDEAPL